jgi:hypothetical protein
VPRPDPCLLPHRSLTGLVPGAVPKASELPSRAAETERGLGASAADVVGAMVSGTGSSDDRASCSSGVVNPIRLTAWPARMR